jgi:periplasmic protein TonB
MFDQMLESRRVGITVASPCSLPIAVMLHVALLVAGFGASYLVIRGIQPPEGFHEITIFIPPRPPAEPPPAGAAAAPAARQRSSERTLEIPQEPFQPQNVPEVALEDVLDTGSSEPTGDPNGSTEGSEGPGATGGVGKEGLGTTGGHPWDLGAGPLIIDHTVTNPVLIPESKVEPQFPEMARTARTPGRVILQAVVEPDGTVGEVRVLRCTRPYVGFEESAIQAVKQWRYEPATQNGRPVAVYFTVLVEFQLN